jgi:hypothetical protein
VSDAEKYAGVAKKTKATRKPRALSKVKIMKNLKTLIIDEISMVRADLLDCVEKALRKFGPNPTKPFGGVQVIFVGDLFQLSPIVAESEKEFLYSHYETPFFFSSNGYQNIQMHKVVLKKVYRQSDAGDIKYSTNAALYR